MKEGLTPSKIDQLLSKINPHPVVVLVDDDVKTLDLLERALADDGYAIYRYGRAEELLQNFALIRPDVIVMEAVLPGISGLSVLEEIRPKSPESTVPVMILSGKGDLNAKLLAFRRGASDYVMKPFEVEEVAVRIHSLVRSKILRELAQESSISDPLTSLYNRRFLLIWLAREIERVRRYGLDLSCLIVDLDRFRQINEENGAAFGDFLLREFGALMMENTRRSDIVGRLQNDEFLVFLPGTSKEQVNHVIRRLRNVVEERSFELKGKKAKADFCAGVVGCHSKEVPDPASFVEKAEEALGRAKSIGAGETAILELN